MNTNFIYSRSLFVWIGPNRLDERVWKKRQPDWTGQRAVENRRPLWPTSYSPPIGLYTHNTFSRLFTFILGCSTSPYLPENSTNDGRVTRRSTKYIASGSIRPQTFHSLRICCRPPGCSRRCIHQCSSKCSGKSLPRSSWFLYTNWRNHWILWYAQTHQLT